MPTIDSDAHVIETMETWSFMAESERRYSPIVVQQEEGDRRRNSEGREMRDYWMVGARIFNRDSNNSSNVSLESREMLSVEARLHHMDAMEVDVQVLYPTLLLRPIVDQAPPELAMAKSYNRWLAGIWKKGGGRLRWAAVPPLRSSESVLRAELEFAKENGACGVFLRGLEVELPLSDEFFHPLYEIASALDLAICIHLGNGSFAVHDFYMRDQPFTKFKLPSIGAFHSLILNETPAKFPKLRWGLVEVSANWLPYIVNDLRLRYRKMGKRLPENVLAANRFYIACEVTDDFAYVLPVAGEDNLVIGTDYGHNDSSSEIEALRLLRDQPGVGARVVDKILWDNPRALYGL